MKITRIKALRQKLLCRRTVRYRRRMRRLTERGNFPFEKGAVLRRLIGILRFLRIPAEILILILSPLLRGIRRWSLPECELS